MAFHMMGNLEFFIRNDGEIERNVNHRIQEGLMKWMNVECPDTSSLNFISFQPLRGIWREEEMGTTKSNTTTIVHPLSFCYRHPPLPRTLTLQRCHHPTPTVSARYPDTLSHHHLLAPSTTSTVTQPFTPCFAP